MIENMESILALLEELKRKGVVLVAVSKTKPVEQILALYHLGQRHFGENRAQELVEKAEKLPRDIHWHMIGHLQRNKVKYIAPFVHLIQSVDNLKLIRMIRKEGRKQNRRIDILLQIKIAQEESKYGFDYAHLYDWLSTTGGEDLDFIRIRGVMGMASFVHDEQQIRDEFAALRKAFDTLKQDIFHDDPAFDTISMGMSGDYGIAIEEGSNMVRIGSLIFGARDVS